MQKNNPMNLKNYIKIFFPAIQHCTWATQQDNFVKDHIWYLYRQIFYGFHSYMDAKTKIYVSKNASVCFEELYAKYVEESKEKKKEPKLLTAETLNWTTQPLIDKGRKELIFEHMYTGTMFRNDAIELFKNNNLTEESIEKLIIDNYKVCLITKEENKWLHKTERGKDPIQYYAETGIEIINL